MSIGKQAVIWFLVIVLGGGLVSLALGHGFWGEKAPPAGAVVVPSGPGIPSSSVACDLTRRCGDCHDQ